MGCEQTRPFLPCLLTVNVSANYVSPNDILWITARWQNRGEAPSRQPLRCFLELEFGHQRIPDTGERFHRKLWEPQPGTEYWGPSEIVSTTCRYRLPALWGGTYRLFLGFCDEDGVPQPLVGEAGRAATRVYIGDIELGWGWGMALLDLVRKPWTRDFNRPATTGYGESSRAPGVELAGDVRVLLDPSQPEIHGIGDEEGSYDFRPLRTVVVLRDHARDRLIYSYQPQVTTEYRGVPVPPRSMSYEATVRFDGVVAARFTLAFEVAGRRLSIRLRESHEAEGWELIEIRMPSLVALAGDDVHIVDFHAGGRLAPLKDARPMGYLHPYDTRGAAALSNARHVVVLESRSLDDRIFVLVQEQNDMKRAAIGAVIGHRLRGHGRVHSIRGPDSHEIHIDVLPAERASPSWLQAARFLRQGLARGPSHELYRRAIHFVYYSSQGPAPEPWQVNEDSPYAIARLNRGLRFDQILDTIVGFSRIFDGMPQVAWIYGYNRQNDPDGTTVSFPWAFETDSRAGTVEELRHAIAEASRHNASLGLYEDYDDLFESRHTEADRRFVALDANGEPCRGWIWADGLSYILGHRKYVEQGAMQGRVRRMFEIYGSRRTGYIDVLTSEVLRYDFDPAFPATPEQSLQSRLAIIEEFNNHGCDVASETLVHPYVGRMGYAHHTRLDPDDALFSGDASIPLLAAVYHGAIGYGGGGATRGAMLRALIHAGTPSFEIDQPGERGCVKWIYLQGMPMGLLYGETMESYREERGVYEIGYSGGGSVRIDLPAYRYEIRAHERLVAKDWTTFVPGFREGSYLAYSLAGGTMSYPAPDEWNEGVALRAVVLTTSGEGAEVPFRVREGMIEIEMPAEAPVRIAPVSIGGRHGDGASSPS